MNSLARRVATPLARSIVRYSPLDKATWWLWWNVIEGHLAWEPHQFVARTRYGAKMAGDTRDILGQRVYYFGLWEPQLTWFLSRRLQPGDTFVDVGANIGYFTLLASQLVGPSGSVVALEASPSVYRSLADNLARNAVGNVRALNVAASAEQAMVPIFRGPETHRGISSLFDHPDLEFEAEVPADALDRLLSPVELAQARLVKIDVEGAEGMVVDGLARLLHAGRRDLEVVVEVDADRLAAHGRRAEDVLDAFADAGFHPYRLQNDYKTWAYLRLPPEAPPVRFEGPVTEQSDLVFSRIDAATL